MSIALLLATSTALASPTHAGGGICPGPMTVEVHGMTPGGRFAVLRSNQYGTSTLPASPCAGTQLDLRDAAPPNQLRFHGIFEADAYGDHEFELDLGPGGCPSKLQMLDMTTCVPSPARPIYTAPTCAPGTLLREAVLGDLIVAPDALAITPYGLTAILFTFGSGNVLRTFDLTSLSQTDTALAGIWGMNAAISYDAISDELWMYGTSSTLGGFARHAADTLALLGTGSPIAGTSAGAIDPATGDGWFGRTSSNSVDVYAPDGSYVTTVLGSMWSGDLEFSHDSRYLYAIDRNTFDIRRFDVRGLTPVQVGAWSFAWGGASGNPYDIAVSREQHVYGLDGAGERILVWDRFGREMTSWDLPAGTTPNAVVFDDASNSLYVGFYEGGTATVREYCGY